MTSKEEAQKKIQQHLATARAEIAEACKLADEHKTSFSWDLAYGMGGEYEGNPDLRSEYSEDGWQSSSHSC